jgi:hypothetical protein
LGHGARGTDKDAGFFVLLLLLLLVLVLVLVLVLDRYTRLGRWSAAGTLPGCDSNFLETVGRIR